jgi:hypothetical protein
LKDRIRKIRKVLAVKDSQQNISNSQTVLGMASGKVDIGELDISVDKTEMSVSSENSLSFSQFLNSLSGTDIYKTIVMSSLSFNPNSGYSAAFEFFKK